MMNDWPLGMDGFFENAVPGASNMFWLHGGGIGPFSDETISAWWAGDVSVEDLKGQLEQWDNLEIKNG